MRDRLPVIVGVGQVTHRAETVAETRAPLTLLTAAAEAALADVGTWEMRGRIDSVRVVNMLSGAPRDPAGALAESIGLGAGERLYTSLGGNSPQWLVNRTADDLAAGRCRAVLLAGAEALHALRLAAKAGVALEWAQRGGRPAMIGDTRLGSHPDEWKHGAQMPVQIYPLFEIALRAREGRAPAAHRAHIARLAASLSAVAAENPHAWFRAARDADEIGTVSARNRMIAYPYTKLMNAIMEVDQAAAVVMTTAAAADALGIPADRQVHLHGGGDAHDLWYLKDRIGYDASPAMAVAFAQALGHARVGVGELAALDLYSCFPVAVEFAAQVLGVPTDGSRPFTVTGGLPYFGGPGNNYGMHAIATMCERLRAAPGTFGFVSGLGWYMTKHSAGVYGTSPPARPWHRDDGAAAQAALDAAPHPVYVAAATGPAAIETYTVLHDRTGRPSESILVLRLAGGGRTFAHGEPDPGFLAALERLEMVGTPGVVQPCVDGRNRFRPAGA